MSKTSFLQLTLLLGPAGCGKTQHCTESFEEALKSSNDLLEDDLLFILPTAEHRARTLDLVLKKALPGFFQKRIITFDRALKEFLKLGGLDFATDVTRRIILKEILGRLKLQYFDPAQRSNGFLNLISHTIVELKENLIRSDELRKKLSLLKKEFPEFSSKYDDLCLIYEAYEKELDSRNLTDQRDSLRLLEEGLTRGEFEKPKLTHVWIDGFSDFSKLQLSFIEFLTRHADHITITLTLDQDPLRAPLFQLVSETQSALEDIGFRPERMKDQNHRAENENLRILERNLFRRSAVSALEGGATPPLQLQTDVNLSPPEMVPNSIQIFEATGLLGEIEMIAREIKKLVRNNHYHFSDVAVLFRATDPYVQVIQSVFRKFEIPFEIHERIRLKSTPIARTLASFLEIFLNGWNRKNVFNFLKSICRGGVTPPLHYQSICDLELAALKKGIFKNRAYWLKGFPEAEPLKRIAQFEDEWLKLKNAAQFSSWVKKIVISFGLLDFPDSSDDPTTCLSAFQADLRLRRTNKWWDEKTRLDRESVRRIFLLLEELKQKHPETIENRRGAVSAPEGGATPPLQLQTDVNLSPPEMVPIVQLAREFLSLMEVDLFSVHSRDKNKVQIYNISLARQKEYKAVFLAGLLEKQFPVQVKEDPVLSDPERRVLNQKGQILKEYLPRQAFERYLFYLAATRTREHLILTYPRFNLEGREALPSFYVDEVCGLFPYELPKKKQPITDVLPAWNEVGTIQEAEALVIRDLWQIPTVTSGTGSAAGQVYQTDSNPSRPEPVPGSVTFAVYNHLIQDPEFRSLLQRLLKPIEGRITDEKIRPYFKRDVWSPTWLEEYAECPFRFFTDRLLKLETQIEGIDIKRRGTILHDVLEHFFTFQRDSKKEVGFEEAKKYCFKKFDELWNEEPLSGDRFYKIELERRRMQEMIVHILRLELIDKKPPIQGLKPAHFEFEFQDIVLKGENREIKLRGKIDRIDVDPEKKFALVIDYKYGKTFKPAALENGTSLQLPFYLVAVREKLGLKPLGGHLYSLLRGTSSGFHHKDNMVQAQVTTRKFNHYPEKEFEEILGRSVLFAEKFVDGIEKGEIPVRPRDCVQYCEYSTICRIEKWRLEHIYRDIEEEDKKPVSVKS